MKLINCKRQRKYESISKRHQHTNPLNSFTHMSHCHKISLNVQYYIRAWTRLSTELETSITNKLHQKHDMILWWSSRIANICRCGQCHCLYNYHIFYSTIMMNAAGMCVWRTEQGANCYLSRTFSGCRREWMFHSIAFVAFSLEINKTKKNNSAYEQCGFLPTIESSAIMIVMLGIISTQTNTIRCTNIFSWLFFIRWRESFVLNLFSGWNFGSLSLLHHISCCPFVDV